MAKAKRYDEGGVTEGQNSGIDDDTRARAMKFVREQAEKSSEDESSGEKTVSRSTKAKVSSKPAEPKADARDAEAGTSRGRPAEGEPKTTMGATRTRTSDEVKAAIPTGGKAGAGPTESKGNSASGSELERNLSAASNTFAPAASKIGKGAVATVKGVQELVASRKAAKAAEAAAEAKKVADAAAKATRASRMAKVAPRAEREAKTMNPNAWTAGPKGMKENFKSGGGVKGWGIARGSRKAKTY